ncbi:nitroreductase family protein [Patescibacteria group bacterium]|nr:nitroreductase family protein [Patescibacteria group bacterium]MBU0963530.1 nitroreductase family protein [Patescibacteria group bacterium]
MAIIKEIQNRRSVRDFKLDKIENFKVAEILQAAQFAPTSRNNQATEFITVINQDTKKLIHEATEKKQDFVLSAPLLIIPVTDPDKTSHPVPDLSLASAHIFLQAEHLGLGAVWKNLRKPPADAIKKILNAPESFILINIIPVGYPAINPAPHNDTETDQHRLHTEKW